MPRSKRKWLFSRPDPKTSPPRHRPARKPPRTPSSFRGSSPKRGYNPPPEQAPLPKKPPQAPPKVDTNIETPETHVSQRVVGNCPHCGAPIYGRTMIYDSEASRPTVTYSCNCRNQVHREKVVLG